MRIVVALIILVVAGGLLTVAYTLQPSSLNSTQVADIKTNCAQCHAVPSFNGSNQIHRAHPFLDCSTCHGVDKTTSNELDDSFRGRPVSSSVCGRCHSVPRYSSVVDLHSNHTAFDCSACHSDETGVATAARTHQILRYCGLVLLVLGLAGLVINYLVTRSRISGKKAPG
jgi:hypothetical protein